MVALSVTIHTLFLYGLRVTESERISEPPRLALNATIATPVAVAPEPTKPFETPLPAIQPVAKKPIAKPPRKKTPTPDPIAERASAMPMPEAALDMAPSPAPAVEPTPEPIVENPATEPAPPPSMASVLERSGAKVRAPTPIENPTMPADDAVVAPPAVATEPIPAIATAPASLEPIAQDLPPPGALSS